MGTDREFRVVGCEYPPIALRLRVGEERIRLLIYKNEDAFYDLPAALRPAGAKYVPDVGIVALVPDDQPPPLRAGVGGPAGGSGTAEPSTTSSRPGACGVAGGESPRS